MLQQTIDEATETSRQVALKVLALQTAPLPEADLATDVTSLSSTSIVLCRTTAALP